MILKIPNATLILICTSTSTSTSTWIVAYNRHSSTGTPIELGSVAGGLGGAPQSTEIIQTTVMASDESMTIRSCISKQENEYDEDTDDGFVQQPHPHSLSRLSMCSTSGTDHKDIMDDDINHDDHGNYYYHGQDEAQADTTTGMNMFMSLSSMESFDGDIDEETFSSNHKPPKQLLLEAGLSSDSDKEPSSYSLPATPPRRRAPAGMLHYNKHPNPMMLKECASENEAQTVMSDISRKRSRRRTRRTRINSRYSWLLASPDRGNIAKKKDDDDTKDAKNMMIARVGSSQLGHCHSFSGESEGGSVVVITRPKGGKRSLCMDLEEVKACRDLGFELEHQHMLHEMPSRLSLSASTLDTNTTCSSGSNSPIVNWRISSPGDDPREVKARIKVWAQAVALASTSRQGI